MTKNSGCKQLAAALLAPGVTVLRNLPPVADLDVMIDVLRAVGADVEWAGPDELRIDTLGAVDPRGAVRAGQPDAGVDQRARSAARPLR